MLLARLISLIYSQLIHGGHNDAAENLSKAVEMPSNVETSNFLRETVEKSQSNTDSRADDKLPTETAEQREHFAFRRSILEK
jgi:hypothetical protein